MFTYNIRGENIEVTPSIREYLESKVGKIEKYFDRDIEATVYANVRTYSDGTAKCEVTIPLPHDLTLRAEETSQDLYGSIDLVVDKLERQIRKHKTKINRKQRESGLEEFTFVDEADDQEETNDIQIVRNKQLQLKPMDEVEAVLQMEMLNHDFFIYEDAETMNINIVYKRQDGQYGLIETE